MLVYRKVLISLLAVGLAGCGSSGGESGTGGASVDEARALNEAAAMLDQRSANASAALNAVTVR